MTGQRIGVLPVLLLLVGCGNLVTVESPDDRSPGDITAGPLSGMNFAYIPSGSFSMGSPTSDPDSNNNERPVHTVTFIYSFEMMTTEVTQGMWEEVMGSNPSYFSGASRPVECVSWDDCQDFVDAMNALDPDHEYRLPSAAEWEYCCRAGTTTRFYWGDDPDCSQIGQYAWYGGNSGDETHPVAQKLHNAWNLYDMSGNVWEWCQDYRHKDYDGAPTNGSAWLHPSNSSRILHGGSRYNTARYCRSAHCANYTPDMRYNYLGFRLARTAL